MRAVIQRVSSAQVSVDGEVVGRVGRGFLVLLGIAPDEPLDRFDSRQFLPERCLLYTSPSPRDRTRYRMPSSA